MMSDWAPEKVLLYALYWQKALSQKILISLYFSPSKFVTKSVCPLNQSIANHTTMMNDIGVARDGENGIFNIYF